MFKLNRRSFVLSTAALAASSGLVGRATSADSGSIRILMNGGDADLADLYAFVQSRPKAATPPALQ